MEERVTGFKTDLKYAVNETKGEAYSHRMSLSRVGKHSYVLRPATGVDDDFSDHIRGALDPCEESKLDLKEIGMHSYVLTESKRVFGLSGTPNDAFKSPMSPYQSYIEKVGGNMDHVYAHLRHRGSS